MSTNNEIELKRANAHKFVGKIPGKILVIAIAVNLVLLGIIYFIVEYLSLDNINFSFKKIFGL